MNALSRASFAPTSAPGPTCRCGRRRPPLRRPPRGRPPPAAAPPPAQGVLRGTQGVLRGTQGVLRGRGGLWGPGQRCVSAQHPALRLSTLEYPASTSAPARCESPDRMLGPSAPAAITCHRSRSPSRARARVRACVVSVRMCLRVRVSVCVRVSARGLPGCVWVCVCVCVRAWACAHVSVIRRGPCIGGVRAWGDCTARLRTRVRACVVRRVCQRSPEGAGAVPRVCRTAGPAPCLKRKLDRRDALLRHLQRAASRMRAGPGADVGRPRPARARAGNTRRRIALTGGGFPPSRSACAATPVPRMNSAVAVPAQRGESRPTCDRHARPGRCERAIRTQPLKPVPVRRAL
jgi:hypothetical protein